MSRYFILVLILFVSSCNRGSKEPLGPDTPENRTLEALQIVQLYPTEEWKIHVLSRIESQTGSQAASKFKAKIESMYSPDEINNYRLKLLRDTFTVSELRLIRDLLKNPEGKNVVKKIYIADEELRSTVAPELSRILSGQSN